MDKGKGFSTFFPDFSLPPFDSPENTTTQTLSDKFKSFAKSRLRNSPAVYSALSRVYHRLKSAGRLISKSSIFNEKDLLPACSLFPQEVLDLAIKHYDPKSVLDIGCGTGKSLDYFLDRGIDAWGVEGSAMAIKCAVNSDRIIRRNLNAPVLLGRTFDLVWSYEVAEHIHPDFVGCLMSSLTVHADHIILSAARPGQGGEGHFNEQPPEYWIQKFGDRGFRLNRLLTAAAHRCRTPYCENVLAFDRDATGQLLQPG